MRRSVLSAVKQQHSGPLPPTIRGRLWVEGNRTGGERRGSEPPFCPSTSVETGAAVGKRGGGDSLDLGRGSHRAGQAGAQGPPGRQATDRSALKSERPGETLTLYPSAPTPQEASGLPPHPGQPLRGASWRWGHQGAVQTPQDQGTHAATRHPLP